MNTSARLWTFAAIVAVGLGVLFQRFPRSNDVAQPPREVSLTELVLRDGRSYRTNEALPFTGILVGRYADGSLRSRSIMSNGVLQGLSEGWYTNGIPEVREEFVGGISHGQRLKWYPDGARMSEATIRNGKLEGTFLRWHEGGALAEEISLSNNVPNGISRGYDTNGSLRVEATMAAGRLLERHEFGTAR